MIPETVAGPGPVLVMVTAIGVLGDPTACCPKSSELGLVARTPAGNTPEPLKLTVWGELLAVLVMVSVAAKTVAVAGENETFTWMLCDGPMETGSTTPLMVKAGFELVIAVTEAGPCPVFEIVTGRGALVAPTDCWPNANVLGLAASTPAGITPLPERVTL